MRFSSISIPFSRAISEPVANDGVVLVSTIAVLPSLPVTSTLPVPRDLSLAADDIDLVFLHQGIRRPLTLPVDALLL